MKKLYIIIQLFALSFFISSCNNKQIEDDTTYEQLPSSRRDSIYMTLRELYTKQNYIEAERIIDKVKPQSDADIDYFSIKAKIKYNRQKFTEALFAINSALKINSHNSTLNYLKGSCYAALDFSDSSLIYINRAISFDSLNPGYIMARARLYEQMNIPILQLDDINRLLKLDSNNLDYKFNLYLFKYNHGDMLGAKRGYESVLEKHPDNCVALKSIGFIYMHQKNIKEAKKYLEKCIEIEPTDGEVFFAMASIFSKEKKEEKACDCLLKAVELKDEEAMKHIYKCEDYLRKKGILLRSEEDTLRQTNEQSNNSTNI